MSNFLSIVYGRLNNSPQRWVTMSLSPEPVNMFQICQRDFAGMIKLRDFKYFSGFSRWTWGNHKGPYKTENHVTREVEGQREILEDVVLLAWKVEDGPQVKKYRWPLKAKEGKEIDSSLKHPEGMQPLIHFRIFDFQNCKKINLWGFFKPLSLWSFVAAIVTQSETNTYTFYLRICSLSIIKLSRCPFFYVSPSFSSCLKSLVSGLSPNWKHTTILPL